MRAILLTFATLSLTACAGFGEFINALPPAPPPHHDWHAPPPAVVVVHQAPVVHRAPTPRAAPAPAHSKPAPKKVLAKDKKP